MHAKRRKENKVGTELGSGKLSTVVAPFREAIPKNHNCELFQRGLCAVTVKTRY